MNKPIISEKVDVFLNQDGSAEVFNQLNKKSYRLGQREYEILKELDGTKTCNDLSNIFSYFSLEMMENLILKFEKIGFIKGKETKEKFNILKIRMRLMNPNAILKSDSFMVRLIYFCIMYLSIPLFLIGLFVNINDFNLIIRVIENDIMLPSIIFVIPIFFSVLALHEIGHAVVARYNNMNVAEFGVMLYWFMPCAYTNLNGISFVEKRRSRLSILFAGILVNLGLAGTGMIALSFFEGVRYDFILWFSLSNITICFTNLVLFLKYDGYYILEQFVEVKNLREKSFTFLKNLSNRKKFKYTMKDFNAEIINNGYEVNTLENGVYVISGIFSSIFITVIVCNIVLIVGSLIWRVL